MGPKFLIREGQQPIVRRFFDEAGLNWSVTNVETPDSDSGIPGSFLCFERGIDRRRLTPIPSDWTVCTDARLVELLRQARPVHRAFASPEQFTNRRRY